MRVLAIAGILLLPANAQATYSIAAVDTATQQVGGAGTSCVGSNVIRIYGSVPGAGVAHAQAYMSQAGLQRSVMRLGDGVAPADILAEITSANFDPNADIRQYGIIDLDGRAAAFTGANNGAHASDRTGTFETFVYAAQGNILTGRGVIDRTADAFESGGCDLAERLMRALEAGAENGEGDTRCTPGGIPSDSAFIQVDRPGEPRGSFLRLESDNATTVSPLVGLRQQLDAWRLTHPCPAPIDAGLAFDAAPADAIDDGGSIDADPRDSGVDGAIADAGAPNDGGRLDAGDVTSNEESGCSCSSSHRPNASIGFNALLLAYGRAFGRRAVPRRTRA